MYELYHQILGVIYVFLGTLGGFFALRTLIMLYKSSEMLKTQKGIWLPILISMLFFTIGGVLHIAEHSFYPSPETDLLHEVVIVTGLFIFTVSVLKYSQLQRNYYRFKQKVSARVQLE